MAEHNLTIKATLDTSSVQRELDQINKNIMTMDGATGTGGSRGGLNQTIVKQLQMSIDQLNRTLGKIELNARHARQLTSIPRGAGYVGIPDASVVPFMGAGWNGFGEWIKANRLSRPTKMGLHFGAVQLGNLASVLEGEDGSPTAASATASILSGILGGASAGSLLGPKGAAVGAIVGGFSAATKAIEQFTKAALDAAQKLSDIQNSYKKLEESEKMSDFQKRIAALGTDLGKGQFPYIQRAEDLFNNSDLEMGYEEALENEANRVYEEMLKTHGDLKALKEDLKIGYTLLNKNNLSPAEKEMLMEQQTERFKQLPVVQNQLKVWEELHKQIKELLSSAIKEAGDEAEKEYNERMKWLEELKKGYHELGQLETQRKELFQSIQDAYIQQGVDILSTMGKSGKYMSQMEVASLNQNRFSPITTRMDKMDKQLEHLRKIDSKIDKIKTGLL